MFRILFIVALLLFISTACSKELINKKSLNYEDFKQLKPDMDYTKLIEKFGKPDKDVGSGIHIYVYLLADKTEIWIGYTDAVLYAKHLDSNQNLLHIII